jgi:hypothetical protein
MRHDVFEGFVDAVRVRTPRGWWRTVRQQDNPLQAEENGHGRAAKADPNATRGPVTG